LLLKLGLLSKLDMASIAAYCVVYDRWRKAELKVRRHGELIVINSMGYLQQNPWLNVANKCLQQMKEFYAEYGLTPAARTKLHVMTDLIDQPKTAKPIPTEGPSQKQTESILDEVLGEMDRGYATGQSGDA